MHEKDHRKSEERGSAKNAAADEKPAANGNWKQLQRRLGNRAFSKTLEQAGAKAPAIVGEVLQSSGKPLDPATRGDFESSFRQDFDNVRIHADVRAAQSARSIGALAYTSGHDIVFGPGQYQPGSSSGRRLIAHELAHTAQQSGASPAGPLKIGPPGGDHERSAEESANRFSRGVTTPAARLGQPPAGTGIVQRAPAPEGPESAGATPEKYAARPLGETKPVPTPGQEFAEHQIAEFDVEPGTKRPWNLNNLAKRIVGELSGSSRAFVRIFGVYPTKAGEANPSAAGLERAQVVKSGLMQWLGKYPEDRFDVGLAAGEEGDAQIRVDIAYKGISSGPLDSPNISAAPSTKPAKAEPKKKAPEERGTSRGSSLQWGWHANLTGAKSNTKDRTVQFSIGDKWMYQVSFNLDMKQPQLVGGYQFTSDNVLPYSLSESIRKIFEIKGFVQLLGGVAATGQPTSGLLVVFQPSAGGQISVTAGNFSAGVQAAGGVTLQQGQRPTADVTVAPGLTWKF